MNEIVDLLVSELDKQTEKVAVSNSIHLFGRRDSRYLRGIAAKAKKFGIAVRWKDIPPTEMISVPFVVDRESFEDTECSTIFGSIDFDLDNIYYTNKLSCTAQACLMILDAYGAIQYNHIGVIGRGHAVQGLREELLRKDATVTICHSHTRNLVFAVTSCDVLVNAAPGTDVKYIPPFGKHLILDVSGSMKELFDGIPAVTYVGMRDIGRLNTSILLNRFCRWSG